MTFSDAMKTRRSVYNLEKKAPIPDDEIVGLVTDAMLHTPSAFNGQSARAAVLFGSAADDLWDITLAELKKVTPSDKFAATQEKIAGFKNSYGTVLYFQDTAVTDKLINAFPLYKNMFPEWAQQENGMLQINIWQSFADHGIGASLQHYNPLIDEAVKARYNIPASWRVIAEMPFGVFAGKPDDKAKQKIEERMKVYQQ